MAGVDVLDADHDWPSALKQLELLISHYPVFTTDDEFVVLQRSLSCVQPEHGEGGSTDWSAEPHFYRWYLTSCGIDEVCPSPAGGAFYNNCLEKIGLLTGLRSFTFGYTRSFITAPR